MYIWGVPAPNVHQFVRDWPERGEDCWSQDMKIGLIGKVVQLFFSSSVLVCQLTVRWHPGFTVQWLGKKTESKSIYIRSKRNGWSVQRSCAKKDKQKSVQLNLWRHNLGWSHLFGIHPNRFRLLAAVSLSTVCVLIFKQKVTYCRKA